MAADRIGEIFLSRRNTSSFESTEQGTSSRLTFPLIVAVHSAVIGGTLLYGDGRARKRWLIPLMVAQPLRYWMLASLGRRWNCRGAVPTEMEVATGGPYAYIRHPNYTVVGIELLCLPMAFGLRTLAAVTSLANAVLLGIRIQDEEAMLMRLPGYREHFEDKPRFIPGLI